MPQLNAMAAQDLGLGMGGAGSLLQNEVDLTEEERKKKLLAMGKDLLNQNGSGGMGLAAQNLLGTFRGY